MTELDQSARCVLLDQCQVLANKLWSKHLLVVPSKKILIAVSGIPGAGKSTIAQLVVDSLNTIHQQKTGDKNRKFAVNIPMDGFHYSRAYLRQMPEPEVAIHRRGAAFTYDAEGYLRFIQKLHASTTTGPTTIYAPSFDHAAKDPKLDDIAIHPESRIIVIEGNYCALDRLPWSQAASLMDELWFIDVDREIAKHRLAKRHVESGICPDIQSAYDRIRTSDMLNADDIVENLLEVDEVIRI